MIRRFCDACGAEIERNYVSQRLVAEKTFRRDRSTLSPLKVKVECMVTIDDTSNSGDMCRDCIIDTVAMADTRPQDGLTGLARAFMPTQPQRPDPTKYERRP